jgi:hypothetical protein
MAAAARRPTLAVTMAGLSRAVWVIPIRLHHQNPLRPPGGLLNNIP